MTSPINTISDSRMPWRLRLAYKLGFTWRISPLTKEMAALEHSTMITTHYEFPLMDRLRFLISGRMRVVQHVFTDVEVKEAHTRLGRRILAPGDGWND